MSVTTAVPGIQLTLAPRGGGTFILNSGTHFLRADYFLRKRSSRTTSAPSHGFAGSSWFTAAGAGKGVVRAEGAGNAGRLAAGVSVAALDGSNCKPNCTDGSKKLLMELNGTTRRSGMPPNDRPTSKRSSVTTRSQNWC